MNTSLYGGVIELAPDGQPITPELVLAFRSGTKQGTIRNISNFTITKYLAEADEITFDVHKSVDGAECKLWDDITDFKLIYIPYFDSNDNNPWYELEVTIDENDEAVKHCEGVHIQEAELSQLSLNGVEINTEDDIARDDYVVTVVYNKDNPDGSLLNRILKDKAPHYEIWHVDPSIAKLQRTFSWNNSTIKDAFDDIATEVDGLFRYGEYNDPDGKIHRTISLYDLEDVCVDCGERGSFIDGKCTNCGSSNIKRGYGQDSGIFINSENFAKSITYSSNKDKVKNCFRLEAGDDLMTATVRNINPNGGQYIWYIGDDVRSIMSPALREKLKSYDAKYAEYNTSKTIDIQESTINDYNALIDKYKAYDKTLAKVSYPIKGYSALTDFYYQALDLYSLLKTSLIPASEHGSPTTASEEIKKLTQSTLSPLGLRNADIASSTTVNLAVANYAKVYVDTSLYKVSANTKSYTNNVWIGTLTLERYSDKEDTATTSELTIKVTSTTADFLKCQIEKAMKKKEADASGIVALFKMPDSEFKERLGYYSADNLELLANICRGCLDIMIEQGVADRSVSAYADLYNTLYLPYYNKSRFIEDELRERESELLKLRGTIDSPEGVLDKIEKQRSAIADSLDLKEHLGDTLWAEFCSFRRDDEYKNSNFISDGLSDSELIKQAKEFLKSAQKEIIKSATLQHTISCNLNDILLVSENDIKQSLVPIVTANGKYVVTHDGSKLVARLIREDTIMSPLLDKFDIGNWLHIEVDDKVYKLRMISYQIDYDDLSKLDVKFSDVTYAIGYMSDTKSILSKMSSMATSYSTTMRQANKGEKANQQLVDMVQNGLALTDKKIVSSARNQNMVVDETGLLMREKNEYGDDYNDEQTKIINYGLYYTKDNWKTVETGLGKFIYYDPEDGNYKQDYGLIANKIVGNIILGKNVGIYNEDNSVSIDEKGVVITANGDNTDNDSIITVRRKTTDGSGNVTTKDLLYQKKNGNLYIDGTVTIAAANVNMTFDDATSKITNLEVDHVSTTDLDATNAKITNLKTEKADIDLANVKNASITTAMIQEAAITQELVADSAIGDAQIANVSANKLYAGTLDASKVNVTNLNATNIKTGTLEVGGVKIDVSNGTAAVNGSALTDGTVPMSSLSEEVQNEIDGAIETWTATAVPTLSNSPASDWGTDSDKNKHIGDICYVVNDSITQNGYAYRFTKSSDGTFSWTLIKDSDVTNALKSIGDIQKFNEEVSSWQTNTDKELSSLKLKTTTIEGNLGEFTESKFNEVSQTVDANTSSITTLQTNVKKAQDTADTNTSNITTISNTVNKVKQTADSNTSEISTLKKTVSDNQTDLESKYNTISQTVDGNSSTITTIKQTANNSVASVESEYVQTDSPTIAPDDSVKWQSTCPTWVDGKYIWTRTKTVKNDGTVVYSDSSCMSGATGATGAKGAKGISVTSTVDEWYLSTSSSSLSGGSWSSTKPTWSSGHYYWRRVKTTYSDGTSKNTPSDNGYYDSAMTAAVSDAATAKSTANTANSTANTAKSTADTAKSTADAAKSEADTNKANITTVTNTVNTVKQTADTNKSNISTLTKTVNDNETDIENKYSNLTQTVNGVSSSVGTLTTKVNNLKIGGRNLWINAGRYTADAPYSMTSNLKDNSKSNFDGKIIYSSIKIPKGTRVLLQGVSNLPWTNVHGGSSNNKNKVGYWIYETAKQNTDTYTNATFIKGDNTTKLSGSYTTTSDCYLTFRFNTYSDGTDPVTGKFWNIKAELGNIQTDWSPAPEDFQTQITSNTSLINQTATAITSKVSKTDFNGQNVVSLINQSADNVTIAANKIDLKGAVTISDLDSNAQSEIQNAKIAADGALEKANAAQNTANSANNNANAIKNNIYVPNTTTINGGKIATGSVKAVQIASGTITADKINVSDLFSKTITATGTIRGATLISANGNIGGWDIQSDAITRRYDDGTYYWDRLMYSGAGVDYLLVRKTKKSDNSVSYPFYVHRDGYLYAENANIKGRVSADYITAQNSIDMYRNTYGEVDSSISMFKYVNSSMTQSGIGGNKDLYVGDGQLENLIFGKFTYGATASQSGINIGSTNILGVNNIECNNVLCSGTVSTTYFNINSKFTVNPTDGVVETCSIIDMHDYASDVGKEDYQIRLRYSAYRNGSGKGLNVQGGNGAAESNLCCMSPNSARAIYLYANADKEGIYVQGGNVNGAAMYVTGSGPQWYGTMHNWSDIRLKKNVTDTEVKSALDTINKIKVRSFDWKATNKHQKVGFIADEIEQVDDAFTSGGGYDENGNLSPKSIDGFYLQAYEVKAIQELNKLVNDLKIENAKLRDRINRIAANNSI